VVQRRGLPRLLNNYCGRGALRDFGAATGLLRQPGREILHRRRRRHTAGRVIQPVRRGPRAEHRGAKGRWNWVPRREWSTSRRLSTTDVQNSSSRSCANLRQARADKNKTPAKRADKRQVNKELLGGVKPDEQDVKPGVEVTTRSTARRRKEGRRERRLGKIPRGAEPRTLRTRGRLDRSRHNGAVTGIRGVVSATQRVRSLRAGCRTGRSFKVFTYDRRAREGDWACWGYRWTAQRDRQNGIKITNVEARAAGSAISPKASSVR